jgi:hypothetical protein
LNKTGKLYFDYLTLKGIVMKQFQVAAGVALIALSVSAYAQGGKQPNQTFSYDYVSVGYDTGKLDLGDGTERTANTSSVQLSKAITETFFLTGTYGSTEINSVTLTNYNLGVGARLPVSSVTDLIATATYANLKTSENNPTGYAVSVGFRHALADKIELGGTYYHSSLSESGQSSTISTIGIEARYKITNELSIGLGYKSYSSDIKGHDYGLNARLEF